MPPLPPPRLRLQRKPGYITQLDKQIDVLSLGHLRSSAACIEHLTYTDGGYFRLHSGFAI